jgi:hypothetical protein
VPVEREQPWIQAQMITAILWSAAVGVAGNGFYDGVRRTLVRTFPKDLPALIQPAEIADRHQQKPYIPEKPPNFINLPV